MKRGRRKTGKRKKGGAVKRQKEKETKNERK
jgi:hypothetical protein